jgi:hypothetical protein
MSNNLTKNGTTEKDQEFFQSKQLQLSQNTEELQLRMTAVMMMKLFLNHPILLMLLIESPILFLTLFPILFPLLVSILLSDQRRVRMKVPLILLVLLLQFSESVP